MPRPPNSKMQSQNMKAVGPEIKGGGTRQVITGDAIGSVKPMSNQMSVDKNPKGNAYWAKRQAASKAAASKENREHADPINARGGPLKKVKPT